MMRDLHAPLSNIAESDARLASEGAWRRGQLSELAEGLSRALYDRREVASARELFSLAAFTAREEGISLPSARDRADLAVFLLREAERRFGRLGPVALLGAAHALPTRGRTVLIDSPPSQEAYTRFSRLLHSPAPLQRSSLRALSDDVASGYADFAVLPLFAGGAPIGSVWGMIEERGLGVLCTTHITADAEEQELGLVARDPAVLLPPTHLAVSYAVNEAEEAVLSLAAAAALGLSPLHFEGAPLFRGADTVICRAVLRGEGISDFIAYLLLFAKDFSVLGLYSEL